MSQNNNKIINYWCNSSTLKGRTALKIKHTLKLTGWRLTIFLALTIKKTTDIIGSTIAIFLLTPILVTTALLIKIEDGGPIFFKQTRVGLKGKKFKMWKFRSMIINADAQKKELRNEMDCDILFKIKEDPRITKVGKFIRKYSIDETPQLFNVLKGDMSLVGPRPAVVKEVEKYSTRDRLRLLVKPGITCIWQVSGRSDINFEGQVNLDIEYIRSNGMLTDLKILLKTIPAVILGKGAY